jgi:hypothetical protein
MGEDKIEKYGIHEIWTRTTDERKQKIYVGEASDAATFVPTGINFPLYDTDVDLTISVGTGKKIAVNAIIDDMRESLKTKLDGTSGDKNLGNPTFAEYTQWMASKDMTLMRKALDYRRTLEIGDRLMWEQVLSDALARRKKGYPKDAIEDRKEAYARYVKILKLNDKYVKAGTADFVVDGNNNKFLKVKLDATNMPTTAESGLNGAAFWEGADFIAYTEFRPEVKALVWKAMPPSAVGKAYLGIASMMLDDVGRGRDEAQLKALYGGNEDVKKLMATMGIMDAVLTVAIDYSQKAYNILTDETNPTEAKEKDFYAIGRAIITEAKLRALRRKQNPDKTIADVDNNVSVTNKLNLWLNGYDIDKQITIKGETKTIEEWMKGNKKLQKYGLLSTPGAAETDVIPLAKIGIVYLRVMAKLELAKLAMEADDIDYNKAVNDVTNAIKLANEVYNDLVAAGGRIPSLMSQVSEGGKLYADKTADYLTYDALKTKADLMALLGNIVGNTDKVTIDGQPMDGDQMLAQALKIYRGIDDYNDPNINNPILTNDARDVSPYQDIKDLSANAELSIRRQLERTDLDLVTKDIARYYDPSTDTDKEYLAATVYPKSFMYYSVLLNESQLLNLRNLTFGEYSITDDGNRNKLLSMPGSGRPDYDPAGNRVSECDAAIARSLAWDIINNVESVKAVNRKGIRDLKFRAYLEAAKSEVRLLKYVTNDEDRIPKVETAVKMFQEIIIRLADRKPEDFTSDKARSDFVDQEYSKLIANGDRKYNKMDYPYYAELYSELASLYEQRAWLVTKDNREKLKEEDIVNNTPIYQAIQAEFNKAISAYKKVYNPEAASGDICRHKNIRGNYDKYVRTANIQLQLLSLETYKINIERIAKSKDEATGANGIITQIDAKISGLKQIKILGKTIEELYKMPVSSNEGGVEKITVGGVSLLKEAIDVLYARACETEAELINKKIFFINKQNVEIYSLTEKESLIKGLYAQSKAVSDKALDKLIDPYYLVQSMVGASMVYMVYNKQDAVDNVNAYYKKMGDNSVLTYEMCEAFSITAAVNKDFGMARKILKSLDPVISEMESKLAKKQAEVAKETNLDMKNRINEQIKGYKDILSQSYMWQGNLFSWFYDERNESGDQADLKTAKTCFEKAIKYNPENMTAKLNLSIIKYRLANLDFKNASREDLTGLKDAANIEILKNAYVTLLGEFKSVADAAVNVTPVRKMTGIEVKMREEEYYADKAKAYRALKMMTFNLINMMQKDKYRLVDWKDIVATTTGVYFEQRFMRGDIVNKTQLESINAGRARQIDEKGQTIALEPLSDQNGAVNKAQGAVLSLEQINAVFSADFLKGIGLDITSIKGEEDMYKVAEKLFSKEKGVISDNLKAKYGMDQAQLKTFSVSDVEVYGARNSDYAINYIVNPTQANSDRFSASTKELESSTDELVKVQASADRATLLGWMAMSSGDLVMLKSAIEGYDKVVKTYQDRQIKVDNELLRNDGEALKIQYYNNRSSAYFDLCKKVYQKVSENNKASLGGMADIDISTMYIANASIYDNPTDQKAMFSAAMDKALESVKYLTGKEFKGTDRSKLTRLYIDYIKGSATLKGDKLVMEALSNLVMAEAWLYTLNEPQDRIGKLVDVSVKDLSANYGFDVKSGTTGTVQIGANYLDIRKKLWDVYTMALPVALRQKNSVEGLRLNSTLAQYSEKVKDKDLRTYVHHLSRSGLIYTMVQIQASYGFTEKKPSALKGVYGNENKFFENKYSLH